MKMRYASRTFGTCAMSLILAGALATGQLLACGSAAVKDGARETAMPAEVLSDEGVGYAYEDTEAMAASPNEVWMPTDYVALGVTDFDTEEYAAVDEGGFVLVATRPLSTVSSDVDTASWCNLRRMVRQGYGLPTGKGSGSQQDDDWYGAADTIPTGAVRIEEMLNYFSYDYDTPADEPFAITAHLGPCPWNSQTELLTLGFASAPEDVAAQKGRNLVFLIDVSGSMDSDDKLGLLQDSFATLLEQLDANDRVSIVTYASGEELVLEGVPGDHQREILRAIYRLRADGSTNGQRGLALAYEVAERNFIEGGVNRIVMASDGDLNVGMTSESELHDYVSQKRETGVYLSVLGFGSGNYKDTKMETLADDGNGSYHYIDCQEEAERVFGERLCANLVPFADDVKLQVEFNLAQVKAYRLIGYENRAMADEDFRDDTADAGDVGPGAQFTVAYEVVRADSELEVGSGDLKYQETVPTGSNEWLTATLRYRSLEDGEVREQEVVVDEAAWQEDPGDDWRFQAAVIELGMLMRGSEHAGTASLESVRELVGEQAEESERAGFIEVLDQLDQR